MMDQTSNHVLYNKNWILEAMIASSGYLLYATIIKLIYFINCYDTC